MPASANLYHTLRAPSLQPPVGSRLECRARATLPLGRPAAALGWRSQGSGPVAEDDDAQRTQHATDSVGPRLRAAAPAVDRVEQEDVRARAERALFGAAEPARIGRFSLLGPIARGGMGVVYGAYDPKLDRRVALKLLHTDRAGDDGTHQRLLDEAKALAKLDHPHVVPVHDVLELDAQIVIVLELLSGRTLAAWQAEQPRSWSELLAVYAAAGRGLAAAHAHGLVHRDFKPHNAIIGDDGRVRVLDFGLAVAAEVGVSAAAAREAELSTPGSAAGTLLYMAPEQLDGLPATAHVDQFAFSVSLYRAAFGSAPFSGTSLGELRASIAAGPREPSGRSAGRAPRWLAAVLRRALAAEPAARFPSMTALLAELERPRGWRRWRLPLACRGRTDTPPGSTW